MVYIHGDTTEVKTYLKWAESQLTAKLHITVSASNDRHIDINRIDMLSELNELWIVKDPTDTYERMSLMYSNNSHPSLPIVKFHLHTLYDYDDGGLITFVGNMPLLEMLDFSGLKNSAPLLNLLNILGDKPLKVLKLNYVEAISIGNSFLKFELNPLTFFKGLNNSNLMCLEMCGNWIISVKPGFTKVLPRLRIFNISNNDIASNENGMALLDLLLHPTIEVLNISTQDTNRQKRSITEKQTNYNIDGDIVAARDKQCRLHYENVLLRRDWSSVCEAWKCTTRSPITCSAFSVNISYDIFIDFSCDPAIKFPIGKNLKELAMTEMNLFPLQNIIVLNNSKTYKLCIAQSSLERLTFSRNQGEVKLSDFSVLGTKVTIEGLKGLSHLDLSYNSLDLVPPEDKMLASFPNLRQLEIQGNNLSVLAAYGNTGRLCDVFQHLTYIDLSFGQIQHIPGNYFLGCNLLSNVALENNSIDESSLMNLLNGFLNVKEIKLKNNKIQVLPGTVREKLKLMSDKSVTIDLSGNPFVCDCSMDSIETVKFLQQKSLDGLVFQDKETYQCYQTYYSAGNQFILNVNTKDIEHLCNQSHLPEILAVVTTLSMMIAVCSSLLLLWRYRFYWLTRYYRLKMRFGNVNQGNFTYDIFISYCQEDRIWVHNVLMKTLQSVYGFKLCIHLRLV